MRAAPGRLHVRSLCMLVYTSSVAWQQNGQPNDERAASSVASTVGIEPTPRVTRPPCTSSMLCCRCGGNPHPNHQLSVSGYLWRGTRFSPPATEARYTNINALIGRPAPSPPRATVTQRTAGLGPRALSGMLLPIAKNPPRWNPSFYYHNIRTTRCEPPQATLRASIPRHPASGPLMIPLCYTKDT